MFWGVVCYLSILVKGRGRVEFNSLAPGKFEWNFRFVIFKQILVIDGWGISCEIALIWMSLDFTDDQSTLVQVMAWCHHRPHELINWLILHLVIHMWNKSSWIYVTTCHIFDTNLLSKLLSVKPPELCCALWNSSPNLDGLFTKYLKCSRCHQSFHHLNLNTFYSTGLWYKTYKSYTNPCSDCRKHQLK